MNDELKREVTAIVAEIAEVEVEEVGPQSTLEELGIDSLGGLRLVAEVEKRYKVIVEESEIPKIRSMPDVLALVERLAGEVG